MFGFVGVVGKVIDLVLTRVAGKHIELSLDKKHQAAKAFVRFYESVTDLQAVLDEFLKYSESFVLQRNFNLRASRIAPIIARLQPASREFVESLGHLGPALRLYDPPLADVLGRIVVMKHGLLQNVYSFFAQSIEAEVSRNGPYPRAPLTSPAAFGYSRVDEYFCSLDLTMPNDILMEVDWNELVERSAHVKGIDIVNLFSAERVRAREIERNTNLLEIIQNNVEHLHIDHSDLPRLTSLHFKLQQHRQILSDALERLRNFIAGQFSISDVLSIIR
jgi:hypothetical protein